MIMKDAFKALKPPDSAPPEVLKEEVFTSLKTLQLIADVIDLFTSQFILSESDMVNLFGSDFYDAPPSPKDGEGGTPDEDESSGNDAPEKNNDE